MGVPAEASNAEPKQLRDLESRPTMLVEELQNYVAALAQRTTDQRAESHGDDQELHGCVSSSGGDVSAIARRVDSLCQTVAVAVRSERNAIANRQTE